jgi:nucleotide-binding universal stress UspA family protein
MPERFFNTAGPVEPADHYCLPPLARSDLAPLRGLIEHKRYFVLHAPRQTGKTTALRSLAGQLREEGRYRAIYANVEVGQAARNDVASGMRAMAAQLAGDALAQGEGFFDRIFHPSSTEKLIEETDRPVLVYHSNN